MEANGSKEGRGGGAASYSDYMRASGGERGRAGERVSEKELEIDGVKGGRVEEEVEEEEEEEEEEGEEEEGKERRGMEQGIERAS